MSYSIASFSDRLASIYNKSEANAIVLQLMQHITEWSKARLLAEREITLTPSQSDAMEDGINRILKHEPIQYILGNVDFHGVTLKVDPRVLIPRPETEELVEWVLQDSNCGHCMILDCCTGSGCIAVALAQQLPNATLFACDISQDALNVAHENALLNNVKVNYFKADVLSPVFSEKVQPIDIIVSNPPYVLKQEKKNMQANVLDFEPHKALFVPEDDPLVFYRAIAQTATRKLTPKGKLFFEINANFGQEVVRILKLAGFNHVELKKDLYSNVRMVSAHR
ncbi:peptide chain release factor N(5)-glutamine methyltransferase [Microbacter margulisiae]|uniref:Release factor glutamine methyltransferase n=1 Tax=Microbacter margulisiae TaxID=1350067 RepID=A0A7W5DTQ7_9PORP|nr:peptide chain release factor N(5)-glutamine methyltransferase [Microbacter margulisiae]MBB3188543.1 release factor glutamine methyltransferase [Microbacter margulisiae]